MKHRSTRRTGYFLRNTWPDERQALSIGILHICPLAQGFHPSSKLCFGHVPKRRFEGVHAGYGGRREVRPARELGEYPESKSPYFCEVCFKRLRRKRFRLERGDERSQLGRRKLWTSAISLRIKSGHTEREWFGQGTTLCNDARRERHKTKDSEH